MVVDAKKKGGIEDITSSISATPDKNTLVYMYNDIKPVLNHFLLVQLPNNHSFEPKIALVD